MEDLLTKSHPQAFEYPMRSGIYTAFVKSGDLLDILKLPDIQRELDRDWVDKLREIFLEHYNQKGYFDIGILDLASHKDSLYLLNGQHRHSVLVDLRLEYPNIPVEIKIRKTESEKDLNGLFIQVNSSKPMKIYKNTDTQVVMNGLRKYFTKKYRSYLSSSARPRRPNLNLDQLMIRFESLDVVNKLEISNKREIIEMIEELNVFYRYTDYATWKSWGVTDIASIIPKCNKSPMNPLYLGIYQNYEWVDRLLCIKKENKTFKEVEHFISNKREKIGKRLRYKVWKKRNDSLQGNCFVCSEKIDFNDFECGHILASFWGGKSELGNLEPICKICNNEMGTENLLDFKENLNKSY